MACNIWRFRPVTLAEYCQLVVDTPHRLIKWGEDWYAWVP